MALVSRHSISIVFPAYNEEDNVASAVEQAAHCAESLFPDWEVIVVDDGSVDRTGEIIDDLAKRNERVVAIHHQGNGGYGKALRSGIMAATKDLVFFCDSDLQFHLGEMVLLLTWIEQYDLVIGYRVRRQDALHRRLNALGWGMLVRLILGLKVKDIDCAFKLFKRPLFQAIKIDAVGAMVNTDILVQATRMGFRLKEVPVTHFPRMKGTQTGANLRVVLKAFRELVQLRAKLAGVRPIVTRVDRRRQEVPIQFSERRKAERRKVNLCINFTDRRRRYVVEQGEGAPVASYPQPVRLEDEA